MEGKDSDRNYFLRRGLIRLSSLDPKEHETRGNQSAPDVKIPGVSKIKIIKIPSGVEIEWVRNYFKSQEHADNSE